MILEVKKCVAVVETVETTHHSSARDRTRTTHHLFLLKNPASAPTRRAARGFGRVGLLSSVIRGGLKPAPRHITIIRVVRVAVTSLSP